MEPRLPPSRNVPRRPHWWRGLQLWQRALLAAVVLGALVIGAGLIYFEPGASVPAPAAPGGLATAVPRYPPGTDEYEYWGQSKPLDQQP